MYVRRNVGVMAAESELTKQLCHMISLFFFFFKSMFYFMGHVGRPWQIQGTYLNMRDYQQKRELRVPRKRKGKT